MKKLLGVSLMALSAVSFAEGYSMPQGLTVGLGYSMGTLDVDGGSDFDLSAVQFRIGNELNENLALRFDYLIGLGDDSLDLGDGDSLDVELSSAFSLFLQPQMNVNEKVKVYGLVGFTRGTIESKINDVSGFFDSEDLGTQEESDTSLSFGVGVNGNVKDNIGLYGEYVSYLREDDYDYSALNLGVTFGF
ncbi:MAG: porin family protein [Oleibacter sp.]|nr:porin family protein [Thalassolituus sp.]